jgi:hypothetical protein
MPAGHHYLAYGTTVRVAEAATTETVVDSVVSPTKK